MGIFAQRQYQGEDKNPFVPNFQGKKLKADLGEEGGGEGMKLECLVVGSANENGDVVQRDGIGWGWI